MNIRRIQQRLLDLGFDPGPVDGKTGPRTIAAIKAFQKAEGLRPDGLAGPRTLAALFPPEHPPVIPADKFDRVSSTRLGKAHPSIQRVMRAAREETPFLILDSQRGRKAQEAAFKGGFSKAHFGQSPHNWSPAIAVDCAPVPLDWHDRRAFVELAEVILPIARAMAVPLRWGGDWHMDGDKTTTDAWDLPHYELTPWRLYAKGCVPYGP